MTQNKFAAQALLVFTATALCVAGQSTFAANEHVMQLLPRCPGDVVVQRDNNKADFQLEGIITEILSPVIGKTISTGLGALGARLTEASSEMKVASIETSGYLYKLQNNEFAINYRCLVIATRSAVSDRRGNLAALTTGYPPVTVQITRDTGARDVTSSDADVCAATDTACPLATSLTQMGFSNRSKPAIVAVFDLELSSEQIEFRFVPRFVAIDHSLREKKRDSKSRDITFELSILLPGEDDPVAQSLLKFEQLLSARPFTLHVDDNGEPEPRMAGRWIPLPAPSSTTASETQKIRDAQDKERINTNVASLAAATILRRTGSNPTEFIGPSRPCNKDVTNYYESFVMAKAELAVHETAATKDNPLTEELALASNKADYYAACKEIVASRDVIRNVMKKGFFDGHESRTINLTMNIKEFRKRPVVAFLADVFSDDDTQDAIGNALSAAIDPKAREAAAIEAATERLAQLEKLEELRVAAEGAIQNYETTADDEKAKLFIAMESAKRAANRQSQVVGIDLPYPESGLWL